MKKALRLLRRSPIHTRSYYTTFLNRFRSYNEHVDCPPGIKENNDSIVPLRERLVGATLCTLLSFELPIITTTPLFRAEGLNPATGQIRRSTSK